MELRYHVLRNFIVSFFVFQVFKNKGSVLGLTADEDVRLVYFSIPAAGNRTILKAGRAMFGSDIKGRSPIESKMKMVEPSNGCTDIENSQELNGKIALVNRGACMFIEKARYIQRTGALAAIVLDNNPGLSSDKVSVFVMHHGYQDDDIVIPLVFLYFVEAQLLLSAYHQYPNMVVGVADVVPISVPTTEVVYMPETEAQTVPETEESLKKTDDHTADGKTQFSPGYIALIVICILIAITVSAVSCYYFCPSTGKMVYNKMRK